MADWRMQEGDKDGMENGGKKIVAKKNSGKRNALCYTFKIIGGRQGGHIDKAPRRSAL